MIKNYFNNEPYDSIDPDTTITYGATINGYMITNQISHKGKKLILLDITPFSLGIQLSRKNFSPLNEVKNLNNYFNCQLNEKETSINPFYKIKLYNKNN